MAHPNFLLRFLKKLPEVKIPITALPVVSYGFGPGVYFLFDQTGEVIYVGKSTYIRTRLESHKYSKRFTYTHFAVFYCREDEADYYERLAISKIDPPFNYFYRPGFTDSRPKRNQVNRS